MTTKPCCGSPYEEHTRQCWKYEPPLTQEEIRGVRAMLRLTGYDSRFAAPPAFPQVGSGVSAPETGSGS